MRSATGTDFTTVQADSYFDLGTVIDRAGRTAEAETAVREALERYLQKGDIVSAERARLWLMTRASALDTYS